MAVYESVIDTIGRTPLIRVRRLAEGLLPRIYVKVEHQNPGGSVKDRAALGMLRAAEADGSLLPGGTVVETTSGNTGIGLALVAAHLGYRSVIFTSPAIADEKIRLLRAYGAEVRLVEGYLPKAHPDSLASQAERFTAETPGAWRAGQYDNPANPEAHVHTTGPEIWDDTAGTVTHFVATVGTGGTISGTGAALKRLGDGRVRVIAADPEASTYSGGDGSPKYVEGAGHALHPDAEQDVWPKSFHVDVVDEYIPVSDRDSILTARRAAREEGLLLGGSAGTVLAAALRLAVRLGEDDVVVVLAPDSGRNVLSTFYDDEWLADRGFEGVADAGAVDRASPLADGHGRGRPDTPAARSPDPAAASIARIVEGPALRVPRSLSTAQAATDLAARGVGADAPVLVVYRTGRSTAPIPPGEVVGATTLRRLQLAIEAGGAGDPLPQHATERPPTVGIGRPAPLALERLDASHPGWSLAGVLSDGRIVGTVSRDLVATHAAGRFVPRAEAVVS